MDSHVQTSFSFPMQIQIQIQWYLHLVNSKVVTYSEIFQSAGN